MFTRLKYVTSMYSQTVDTGLAVFLAGGLGLSLFNIINALSLCLIVCETIMLITCCVIYTQHTKYIYVALVSCD